MAILSGKKYLINSHFYDAPTNMEEYSVYFGTLEELKKTISTTWCRIPHDVEVSLNLVQVKNAADTVLAMFSFFDLTARELPDHF